MRSSELAPLRALGAERSQFVRQRRRDGYVFGVRREQPLALLGEIDAGTWRATLQLSDVAIEFGPMDRDGTDFAARAGVAELAHYRRHRELGGGRLVTVDGWAARLLPARWWRWHWAVKAGGKELAHVVSLPTRQRRLSWTWHVEESRRSPLVLAMACYAILVDDMVTKAAPPTFSGLPIG